MDLKLMCYFQDALDDIRRRVCGDVISDKEFYLHFREVIDSRLDEEYDKAQRLNWER